MKDILSQFILYIKFDLRLSNNNVISYNNDLNKYVSYLRGKSILVPNKISSKNIRNFISELSLKEYKPATVNRIISSIKKFHLYMIDNEFIDSNPSELIESQKNRRNFPDTLSFEEITMILDSIDITNFIGIRDKSILTMLYSTGIRVSELLNLKLSNIYFKEEYIQISGKGKKERIVPIGIIAKKMLLSYLDLIRKKSISNDTGYIYISYRSKRLTRMSIYNIIKKYSNLVGVDKKVSPHTFRHSFATHMLEGGADLRIVQDLLGHENINTTEIYTHLDSTYLKEVHKLCHPRG